jgi:ketosteroid isomerase-like protein
MSHPAPATAALIVLIASCAAARADGALDDVFAADRAFAARAVESGTQAAFLEFLAPDAILFRPSVVNGQEWLRTHEEATGRLEWSPATGAVSCDGQLAVTLGPWTYRQDASAGNGYYMTVWRRNSAGAWEVVVDQGIDGPAGKVVPGAVAVPFPPVGSATASSPCASGGDGNGLADADAKMNAAIHDKGFDASLRHMLLAGGLVLRDGHVPSVPTADWPRDDADLGAPLDATTRGGPATAGADLGYTYGELTRRGTGKSPGDSLAVFLRVWVRDGRSWHLAADLLTPLPATAVP